MEEETTANNKLHTQIEIKPQVQEPALPALPSSSVENPQNSNNQSEGKLPFFKSRYRQRASDTWLISLIVILHLLAFIATTLFNYFLPGNAFFQPLSENPLLGPSASTSDPFTFYLRFFYSIFALWDLDGFFQVFPLWVFLVYVLRIIFH